MVSLSRLSADSEALRSDCMDVQADLELHRPHMTHYVAGYEFIVHMYHTCYVAEERLILYLDNGK